MKVYEGGIWEIKTLVQFAINPNLTLKYFIIKNRHFSVLKFQGCTNLKSQILRSLRLKNVWY